MYKTKNAAFHQRPFTRENRQVICALYLFQKLNWAKSSKKYTGEDITKYMKKLFLQTFGWPFVSSLQCLVFVL